MRENPYREGTVIYQILQGALEENDWSDLTVDEIAEVLQTTGECVKTSIQMIRKKTGFDIRYRKKKAGRKKAT